MSFGNVSHTSKSNVKVENLKFENEQVVKSIVETGKNTCEAIKGLEYDFSNHVNRLNETIKSSNPKIEVTPEVRVEVPKGETHVNNTIKMNLRELRGPIFSIPVVYLLVEGVKLFLQYKGIL